MYKVIVVGDETTIRRGIILTIDWVTPDCVITGEATNGEKGAELTVRLFSDVTVTNARMPRMDGVEMIAELWEQGCRAKFIIPTAHGDFKYAQSALRLGVNDYLLRSLRDGGLKHAVGHIREQMEEHPPRGEETDTVPVLRLHSDEKSKNEYVEATTRYIGGHHREDITISTVASFLEISEGYLSRVFKKEADYTFTNYLAYYRIRMAMSLLRDCRVKVYEVADQMGYSDTAYFSAQSKKILGVSPLEYQDRCRQLQQSEQVMMDRESREKCSVIH